MRTTEWTGNRISVGLVGSLTSRKFALAQGTQLVGRDASQCQIVLEQAVVSRRHAEIAVDEHGRVTLTDLAARHATFVNDVAITRRELQDGDRIGFGPSGVVAFSFHCGGGRWRTPSTARRPPDSRTTVPQTFARSLPPPRRRPRLDARGGAPPITTPAHAPAAAPGGAPPASSGHRQAAVDHRTRARQRHRARCAGRFAPSCRARLRRSHATRYHRHRQHQRHLRRRRAADRRASTRAARSCIHRRLSVAG